MLHFASALAAITLAATPAPPAGEELAALSQPPARTALASQRIYFVMTDRYANGDPSNDRGGLTGPRSVTGYDPAGVGWFHGGDFQGLTASLERIKGLGFTSIWVTPPFGQKAVQGDSAAYHGYWGLDFTTVDAHLGTEADFAAFVARAHALGLKVILDVVVNHTADVILPGGGTSYSDAPYRDCQGKRFKPARFVTARVFPCLRARDFPRPPLVLAADRNAKKPAWLNDVTKYHNRGNVDFGSCSAQCLEQGDFFGLDDLFTEQPAVVKGWARVYGDWIRKYKLDGFRVDTAKHVNAAFFRRWVPEIMAAARSAGVHEFQLFGEAWETNALELVPYVRDRGLPNVLDFPFQDAAVSFAAGEAPARALATRLDDDDYFRLADGTAPTPATFLGNHDLGRAAALIRNKSGGAGPAALLARVLVGHDLLYLLRGAPVVYYGDEVGMMGSGGDKAARQDMFPTEVSDWRTEARVGSGPIGTGSSFERPNHPVAVRLRELARLRDEHPALSTGATIVRAATGAVLAVSRIDAADSREYVAVFNSGVSAARIALATATGATTWTPLLGAPVVEGSLTVTVPPLSSALLRADARIPAAAPPKPSLAVAGDDLSDYWRLTASVPGAPVSVAFAVQREGRAWQRLGVDDSPPYRVFLDAKRFKRNERVHLVAIARGLDGRVAVSDVRAFTVRRR